MQREHRAREQGTHQLSATTAQDVATELHVLLRCVRETRRHGEEAVAFAASERVLVDELPQFVSVIGNRRAEKQRRMVALGQIAKSLAYVASSKATLTPTLTLTLTLTLTPTLTYRAAGAEAGRRGGERRRALRQVHRRLRRQGGKAARLGVFPSYHPAAVVP